MGKRPGGGECKSQSTSPVIGISNFGRFSKVSTCEVASSTSDDQANVNTSREPAVTIKQNEINVPDYSWPSWPKLSPIEEGNEIIAQSNIDNVESQDETLTYDVIASKDDNFNPDNRYYFQVRLENIVVLALCDPGATSCYVGTKIIEKCRSRLKNSPITLVKSANGSTSSVIGILPVMISIDELNYKVNFKAVPNLDYEMILGMDFLQNLKIIIDYSTNMWRAHEGPWQHFHTSNRTSKLDIFAECAGLVEATPSQLEQLHSLLDELIPPSNNEVLGCTHLVEHEIELLSEENP